eukprot:scaffold3042_cov21-Tisochrysis_lutea.AAC.1
MMHTSATSPLPESKETRSDTHTLMDKTVWLWRLDMAVSISFEKHFCRLAKAPTKLTFIPSAANRLSMSTLVAPRSLRSSSALPSLLIS